MARFVSRVFTWQTLPEMKPFTTSTMLCVGRRFFHYSPNTILKLGANEGEAVMTELAHTLLGSVVPYLEAFVLITSAPKPMTGIIIARQPGVPLVELWPDLSLAQRIAVKNRLAMFLVHMRTPREHLDYYGRPFAKPYITLSEVGPDNAHAFCRTRSDWDMSRIDALNAVAPEADIQELKRIQQKTGAVGAPLVNSPVLTHGDLSDRNTLINPDTLEVVGLIDWETANIAPAYFEYALARLSGGHQPEWRKELLEVLHIVLRTECRREVARGSADSQLETESEELFKKTLAAWNALVDVERFAQGYSNACSWTFEN